MVPTQMKRRFMSLDDPLRALWERRACEIECMQICGCGSLSLANNEHGRDVPNRRGARPRGNDSYRWGGKQL